MNRPDKHFNKLSKTERELGGIPNTSEDVKQSHASAIESYIEKHIGFDMDGTHRPQDEIGDMFLIEHLRIGPSLILQTEQSLMPLLVRV